MSDTQQINSLTCFSACAMLVARIDIHISLGHPLGANMEQIRTFSGFSQFFVQGTKISFHGGGGGVCVYFLKSVRKGRFRNVWVKGG